jgi:hypothetical protein
VGGDSTISITNAATGAITRITVIHHAHFRVGLFLLALLAFALITIGLRMLFWTKDSN